MFRARYMQPRAFVSANNKVAADAVVMLEMYEPLRAPAANTVVDDMVRTWWESNGMPVVLTDRVTARCACFLHCRARSYAADASVLPGNFVLGRYVRRSLRE